ncbi:hypothetical protein EGT74_05940 [Chitinophaga lutea]|uniref:Uncharacterized protein n=1 Tax=Chitinophaga lutea TaxID=2488634 RepID=A0A3N4QMZ0_9BACT|nr:hypothetical protein [Chitinophaga lutea]RPE13074.1 hypothetical protein EGT74_05940 [Chitinophaga lutea]
MATSISNNITHGASGTLGDVVFRRMHGKIVLCKRPRPSSKPPSNEQLALRGRFRMAQQYAGRAIKTPSLRAVYASKAKKTGRTVYHLALQDASVAPAIFRLITGPRIRIYARDNFRVQAVSIVIVTASGSIWEEGAAVQQANRFEWTYTLKKLPQADCTLHIVATDLPGNTTGRELIIPAAAFINETRHFG